MFEYFGENIKEENQEFTSGGIEHMSRKSITDTLVELRNQGVFIDLFYNPEFQSPKTAIKRLLALIRSEGSSVFPHLFSDWNGPDINSQELANKLAEHANNAEYPFTIRENFRILKEYHSALVDPENKPPPTLPNLNTSLSKHKELPDLSLCSASERLFMKQIFNTPKNITDKMLVNSQIILDDSGNPLFLKKSSRSKITTDDNGGFEYKTKNETAAGEPTAISLQSIDSNEGFTIPAGSLFFINTDRKFFRKKVSMPSGKKAAVIPNDEVLENEIFFLRYTVFSYPHDSKHEAGRFLEALQEYVQKLAQGDYLAKNSEGYFPDSTDYHWVTPEMLSQYIADHM